MLAYKTKPQNKPINRTTNIKRKKALSENAKHKLLGLAMILLAIPAMFITNEFGEPDGTASVMIIFMGLAALFAK